MLDFTKAPCLAIILLLALALTIVTALPGATAPAPPGEPPAGCPCIDSAATLLSACEGDARNAYWLGRGDCPDPDEESERTRCLTRQRQELTEMLEHCRHRFEVSRIVCALLQDGGCPSLEEAGLAGGPDAAARRRMADGRWSLRLPGESGETRKVEAVTGDARERLGITCTGVRETVYVEGKLVGETFTWYAQDRDGVISWFEQPPQELDDCFAIALEGASELPQDAE